MPAPYDYTINVQNPFEAAVGGLRLGATMADIRDRQAAQQAQAQNQQAAEMAKQQADADLLFGGQVLSAFKSGQDDIGIKLISDRAAAERNSGREDYAKAYETYAELAKVNPRAVEDIVTPMLAGMPGGDKLLGSLNNNLKATSEARNIDSQIAERANKLSLDKDKMRTDVELKLYELGQANNKLDPDARKIVNDSSIASVAAEQFASRIIDLAGRIESAEGGKGYFTRASQWLADATGNQDEWMQLRKEYTRLRNIQAIKSLPPGPPTDKDMELALEGFPKDTANSETLASFLRGMAKLQQIEASAKSAEAEWVNSTGSLGRARTDINIGGVQVPAGTTFVDFMRQYSDKRASGIAAQQSNAATSQRSYMRWANPQTGQTPTQNQ